MNDDEISRVILDSAYKVHTKLGPGLLESTYRACLAYELRKVGLNVEEEKALPLIYEEIKLECGYRIDLLINSRVIVELKTVEAFKDVHFAQTLTYIRLSNLHLGLLINFHTKSLKDGIKRLVI
ncbi:MAG: GxxExxY protein [Paludibacter sp.]